MANINNKRVLAEQLKAKLNSSEYVAMPDLIVDGDQMGDISLWLLKGGVHGKGNWIGGIDINPSKEGGYKNIVYWNELEKNDWEEIVNLIEKRSKEREQIYDQKKKNIEKKINSQANLYYYWGLPVRGNRADVHMSDKGGRGYVTLLGGRGNGLTYHLYIAENHPILDNFPFQIGYYSIDTDRSIEKRGGRYNGYRCTGGESNPFNFVKFVEVGDKITITPYEVANKPVEKPSKKDNSRINNQIVGSERDNSSQPVKKITNEEERKITEYLIHCFKSNQIKKIELAANDELIITYNNNKETINDNYSEYQIKNSLQKLNKNKLTSQELGINFNDSANTNNSQPNNSKYWWLVGGIGVGVAIAGMVGIFYLSRKRKNK